ncbi:MAG TPA: hypothetical protein VLY45_05545 [Nitrospiria bacterium]|nr:hypothetical protein [Nitrospiria bacterium]
MDKTPPRKDSSFDLSLRARIEHGGTGGQAPSVVPSTPPKTIPQQEFVNLGDRRTLADELKKSVQLCHQQERYVAIMCIIVCGIDAFASTSRVVTPIAHKKTYMSILQKHFPVLSQQLGRRRFYEIYRNGIVHQFYPGRGYIMGQDQDLNGQYVAEVELEGRPGKIISLNIDRLTQDFIKLCDYIIQTGAPLP